MADYTEVDKIIHQGHYTPMFWWRIMPYVDGTRSILACMNMQASNCVKI